MNSYINSVVVVFALSVASGAAAQDLIVIGETGRANLCTFAFGEFACTGTTSVDPVPSGGSESVRVLEVDSGSNGLAVLRGNALDLHQNDGTGGLAREIELVTTTTTLDRSYGAFDLGTRVGVSSFVVLGAGFTDSSVCEVNGQNCETIETGFVDFTDIQVLYGLSTFTAANFAFSTLAGNDGVCIDDGSGDYECTLAPESPSGRTSAVAFHSGIFAFADSPTPGSGDAGLRACTLNVDQALECERLQLGTRYSQVHFGRLLFQGGSTAVSLLGVHATGVTICQSPDDVSGGYTCVEAVFDTAGDAEVDPESVYPAFVNPGGLEDLVVWTESGLEFCVNENDGQFACSLAQCFGGCESPVAYAVGDFGINVDEDEDGVADRDDLCFGIDNVDADGDYVCDDLDLCLGRDSSGDSDEDGVCDSDDLCDGDDNTGDADDDDVCDDRDACTGRDSSGDTDEDGVCDSIDICVGFDHVGDDDDDGVCNDQDACEGDDFSGDSDEDFVCDDLDVCEGNDRIGDQDEDGLCDDGTDPCPEGPQSLDRDRDGVADACDLCEGDDASFDTDNDGICENRDICEGTSNVDSDGDGLCDERDRCFGRGPDDDDLDGICNERDLCTGDDSTFDADGDGVCGDLDLCSGPDSIGDPDGDGVCGMDQSDAPTDEGGCSSVGTRASNGIWALCALGLVCLNRRRREHAA